jgi:hypothetical protein
MRSLISMLLLACFAWTQAMAADCPMAPAPSGQAEHAPASASPHHGHHTPAPVPAGQDDPRHPPAPAQHLAGGCGVLMSCGAAAAAPLAASLPALDAPRADGLAAGRDSYASPTLSTDPPPPRTALRS